MKVKSTGLGKTQLQCHFDGFAKKENGEPSVVMVITSTEPVHWHIEADLGGRDLRQMAGQMLKPAIVWHLLKLLAMGSEAKGFVMEKDGGRRSTRDRVQREPAQRDLSATAPVAAAAAAPAAAPTTAAVQAPAPAVGAAGPVSGSPAGPAGGAAQRTTKADSSELSDREAKRAELRRQREEAAKQYAAV
jgi:hypothetical protein